MSERGWRRVAFTFALTALLWGCRAKQPPPAPAAARAAAATSMPEYYGTLEPFASEAVYFVMTDRFVDGDPSNDQRDQGDGPDTRTFDRPITDLEGRHGNIGYLGGDFRGILDHADYIADMGFTAVWITPIVDNPDEAFTGGHKLGESFFADHGKTGYHGYWGVNFYQVDEHLESADLRFADYTHAMKADHGLKTVLDVVCNHGSPSYTMPADQPKFGEIYDASGRLVADHQNLPPEQLDASNPLHAFFHHEGELAELSNIDDTNPVVLDYFTGAYLKWIDAGADAFRIDTIRHMPHAYWKAFAERIRAHHPGFFMYGEAFDYDAAHIAEHTWPENGAISVLDFPGQQRISELYSHPGSDFAALPDYLHLDDRLYENPYELMIFYDNHDMPRMNADPKGFIDADNWLFTSRGIPVVYYGSEMAFRAGMPEHGGNRDYYGVDNIERAQASPIRAALASIAAIRRQSPALQRGLQVNLLFDGDRAAFYRVYQHAGTAQTALVLLNKGGTPASFDIERWLASGPWRDAASGEVFDVAPAAALVTAVPAHGVRVLLLDAPNDSAPLARELDRLQAARQR
jgi:glycosidase